MVKKICLIRDICGCFNSEKKEFSHNSSPSTLQVIVTLWVTAVIHFKTLVTLKRVTSELAMQLILFQYDIPDNGDEWVTSEAK